MEKLRIILDANAVHNQKSRSEPRFPAIKVKVESLNLKTKTKVPLPILIMKIDENLKYVQKIRGTREDNLSMHHQFKRRSPRAILRLLKKKFKAMNFTAQKIIPMLSN